MQVAAATHRMNVFLVEDSAQVVQRLEEMLAAIDGVRTVGSAASADEAIREVLTLHPDAVLCDISLAQGTGFDVLRALQESLTNIARHAKARQVWVSLGAENGDIYFEVEDDGRGIEPADFAKARSLGLKGMRERMQYLGGSIEVARAPRGGTRVRVRVPAQGQAQ